jgi:hypothetical protein
VISCLGILGVDLECVFERSLGFLPVAVQIQMRRGEPVVNFPQRLVETPGGCERHFELAPRASSAAVPVAHRRLSRPANRQRCTLAGGRRPPTDGGRRVTAVRDGVDARPERRPALPSLVQRLDAVRQLRRRDYERLRGYGTPRYECLRRSKNGPSACVNHLTIRANVADAMLLNGLQCELLRPETVAYVTARLTEALHTLADQRPQQRALLERSRATVAHKLQHLIAAVEADAGAPTVFQAIRDRESELRSLERELAATREPIAERLTVIPTWVRQQLEDVAGLLRETPARAKAEFQRLAIRFTIHPVFNEPPRPFLRAEGSGQFEHLAFGRVPPFTTTQRLHRLPAPWSRSLSTIAPSSA